MYTGTSTTHAKSTGREGSALLTSLLVVVVLSGIAVAALAMSLAHKKEASATIRQSKSFYMAEAGLNQTLFELTAATQAGSTVPVTVGTVNAPINYKGGAYWCDVVANPEGTYTVTATGAANFERTTVQAVLRANGGSVWDTAIFAGNSGADPDYTLELGGVGIQGDEVIGNIYSGGDVDVDGDATVSGVIDAVGTITGASGTENQPHPVPDIAGMNYETNHDFDVSAMFAAGGLSASNPLGGTAFELPEDSPAHIFRMNPNDRLDEINDTAKDDYFLEDPYMPTTDFTDPELGSGHTITLSGASGGQPGPEGSNKVYYIDGNLWVHNGPFGRLRLKHDGPDGAKVVFVVKGNVYFSDDVLVTDPDTDAVAFIAIVDENEPDSGNIYMGDPRYGTLDYMEAFMYAENNFYDNNLDESGSSTVKVKGNMTAGNQVAINRDFEDEGVVQHSKLTVEFDDRLSTGMITLPGLPTPPNLTNGFQVVFWRQIED